MKSRELLIYLSIKYEGDWDKIYQAIQVREAVDVNEAEKVIKANKAEIVTCVDENYPLCLKNAFHPPFVLYYYGDLNLINNRNKTRLGVIGTRSPSQYGLSTAKNFTSELAQDFVIVSGLARGIDTVALRTAMEEQGNVIAVLGSGIERCYPNENSIIFQEIRKKHLLISEYPLDTPPRDTNFPFRNRLIAAFSDAILVAEAKKRSGTLITVGHALSLGRDIYCIPHRVGESVSTNLLIRDGAYLAESPEDIKESVYKRVIA